MKDWTQTKPGYKTKTVKGEGFTVIIHRPELSAEMYAKREKEVLRALSGMRGGATA